MRSRILLLLLAAFIGGMGVAADVAAERQLNHDNVLRRVGA